jgi:serine/threonine-protein kinase
MAAVYRAFDLELEEVVALKVFDVAQSSDTLVARFKQELKLSRQLIHPNIIRLYDIGAHDGRRYISMELLVGKSLKDRMRQPIDFRSALGFLIQACHGLQAAHDAGVVHRDVKPDNFFVTDDGVLKVMDFGIAKQYATPGVTVAGSIAGTPLYMSPEQIGNFSSVTQLTDIYGLGVCAYEMFTGQVPFFHADLVPLLMMHVNDIPLPPRKRNPSVPAELDAVILKCLAKDPKQRQQSCRELAQELIAIRDRFA